MRFIYILSFFLMTVSLNAEEMLRIDLPAEAAVAESCYIPVNVKIRDDGYIYGNPKGPGTGKPTEFFLSYNSKNSNTILSSHPLKYKNFDDWVWIYKRSLKLFIPLSISDISEGSSILTIRIDALFCDKRGRCTPVKAESSITLKKAEINSAFLLRSKPSDTIPVIISQTKREATKNSSAGFEPEFIQSVNVAGLFTAMILGMIAGLILNFMPCVLPVVSLKLAGFVQLGSEERHKVTKHSLAFSAGIFISFMLLAALVTFAGKSWGSLFQSSDFLMAMIIIVFSLALSFLGVYTIGVPQIAAKASFKKFLNPYTDSLFKGSVATLLATPCTGPLLGSTLAWTMGQPSYIVFTVFASIAAGMSIPYLMIAAIPSSVKLLPKPGSWNIVLERITGLLLIGTVVYLVTIVSEKDFVLWYLFFTSLALYIYGEFGNISRGRVSRWLSASLVIAVVAGGFLTYKYWPESESYEREAYSAVKLEEYQRDGKIVIVDFTADWCPNCKLVEKAVLQSGRVAHEIKKRDIKFLVADITRSGTEGEKLLGELGSRSLPFLAIFPAGNNFNKPVCLRDIYTVDDVIRGIELVK